MNMKKENNNEIFQKLPENNINGIDESMNTKIYPTKLSRLIMCSNTDGSIRFVNIATSISNLTNNGSIDGWINNHWMNHGGWYHSNIDDINNGWKNY